jgi:hypothetical protein
MARRESNNPTHRTNWTNEMLKVQARIAEEQKQRQLHQEGDEA